MKEKTNYKLLAEITSFTLLVAGIVFFMFYNLKEREKEEKERISEVLFTIIKLENQALNSWFKHKKSHVEDVVNSPKVIDFTTQLLEISPDKDSLLSHPIQQEIRSYFDPILNKHDYFGIFVISPEYISLSSMRDENIGGLNVIAKNQEEKLKRAFEGETVLITPFISEVVLDKPDILSATMFIASPVKNSEGETIAVFTFRIKPKESLSSYTENSWFGKTNNTYAFDSKGRVITQSRHESTENDTNKKVDIRGFGTNLINPYTGELVYSAKEALHTKQQGINTNGYINYQGEITYGAWVWNDQLDLGLTCEISEEESMSNYYSYRYSLIIAVSFIFLLLFFSFALVMKSRRRGIFLNKKLKAEMGLLKNSLSEFIANVPVGIVRMTDKGKFIEMNDEFCHITGYNRDELLELTHGEITASYPGDKESNIFTELKKEGKFDFYEEKYTHKSGELREVILNGIFTDSSTPKKDIWLIVQDITNRKKSERELRQNRERLQIAVKAGRLGVWDWNLTSGLLIWDDSMLQLFDISRDEFGNDYKAFEKMLHPEDVERVNLLTEDAISRDGSLDIAFRIIDKKGNIRHIASKGKVRYDSNGKAVRMTGVNMDITADLETKMALEQSNKELESFAYVASHDLQEPLRVITSYLQIIEKKYAKNIEDRGLYLMERIISASDRMKKLINDLLEYSRIEKKGSAFVKTDLNQLMNTVLKDLELLIKENNATVEVGDLGSVFCDPRQISQVFMNLVSNGIKYHQSGTNPKIIISSRMRNKSTTEIIFEDNGIGIKPEFHDRIFEIFQRLHTREEFKGTGLGLAITKKIVERHKGTIHVKSQLGEGSKFIIRLPGTPQKQLQNEQEI